MIKHEEKALKFNEELDEMRDSCEALYNKYIMQPRIPYLIKVQKAWRGMRSRR